MKDGWKVTREMGWREKRRGDQFREEIKGRKKRKQEKDDSKEGRKRK